MPLSRLNLPSFSLTLTGPNGEPILAMQDFNPGATSVEVNLQLPQLSAIIAAPAATQPNDQDPLMVGAHWHPKGIVLILSQQTIDTRFHGQVAYHARYAVSLSAR